MKAAIKGGEQGRSTRSGAIRDFDKRLDEALVLVDRIQILIRNTKANDEVFMAAWDVARRLDSPPPAHRKAKATVESQEPIPPTSTIPVPPVVPAGQEAAAATA